MKGLKLFLFYLLSFTWGILLSMVGLLTAIVLLIAGYKPEIFHGRIHFKVGENWGGVNFGVVFITDNSPSLHTKQHECGHGLQNIVLGVFMPFVVCIPSAVRYWIYEYAEKGNLVIFELFLLAIELVLIIGSIVALCFFKMTMFFIIVVFAIYWIIVCSWVILREGKKYTKKPFPKYDSIWFEHNATKLGEKYF